MSHNQTIDGVPRELLVRLCNFHAAGWEDIEPEIKELRALLDAKPAEVTGDDALALTVDHQQFIAGDHEDLIDNASDFQDRAYALGVARGIARCAMQPQGEPVAWRYREGEGTQWRLTDMPPSTWYFDPRQYEVRKLYAEQPAPVAVVLPGQKAVSALVTKAARQADLINDANYYTAAEFAAEAVIDEVKRLNAKSR